MDTAGMRITAVAATMLDDFEPSSWTRLPDAATDRILMTDGDRSLIVTVAAHDRAAAAHAEHIAANALAPLLPQDAPAIPHIIAARTVDGEAVGHTSDVTLTIADPMPGVPLSTAMFEQHPTLVESLARAVARIHSADPGPIADAGLMVEESAETRDRLLADLDSAASTGRVPSLLLSRWEAVLEEVTAWRFLPAPIHASLGPDALWAIDGDVVAVSDLARLRVGDPAADLAAVSSMLSPEDFERFFRSYRAHRDPDDPGLRRRVGFHAEITVLEWLLAAVAAQDDDAIDDAADLLQALAEVTDSVDESDEAAAADDVDVTGGAVAADEAGRADETSGAEQPVEGDGDDEAPQVEAAPQVEVAQAVDPDLRDDSDQTTDPEAARTRPGPPTSANRPAAADSNVFLPSARIDAGVDEDGIATERLDTSALHVSELRGENPESREDDPDVRGPDPADRD